MSRAFPRRVPTPRFPLVEEFPRVTKEKRQGGCLEKAREIKVPPGSQAGNRKYPRERDSRENAVKVSSLARLFACGRTCEARISGTLAACLTQYRRVLTRAAAFRAAADAGAAAEYYSRISCVPSLLSPLLFPRRRAERAKFSRRGISASRATWGSPQLDRPYTMRRYCFDALTWYSYSSAFAWSNFRYCIL